MDGIRFDKIAKTLAGTSSRRAAVTTAIAGAVGATLLGADGREAGAACLNLHKKCKKNGDCCGKNCVGGRCACRKTSVACQGRCCPQAEPNCCPEGMARRCCDVGNSNCCPRTVNGQPAAVECCLDDYPVCCPQSSVSNCCGADKPVCCIAGSVAACCPNGKVCCETGCCDPD